MAPLSYGLHSDCRASLSGNMTQNDIAGPKLFVTGVLQSTTRLTTAIFHGKMEYSKLEVGGTKD